MQSGASEDVRATDACLYAVAGPLIGKTLLLSGAETLLGRDSSSLVCIDSRSVSRQHCVIERKKGNFVLRDLDSLNGTFVNDVPVKVRELKHGDQIAIGDSIFVLVLKDRDEVETAAEFDANAIYGGDVPHLAP